MTVALLALVASAALADDAAPRTVAVDDAGGTFLGAPATYAYAAYAHPWPHPALAFEANFSVSFPAARRCGRPRVAACVLRRRNTCGTGCHYFQHAAVYLAPCLSFFARYDDLEPVVVARDGLYFGFHPWTVGFLEAAGARLVQQAVPRCAVAAEFDGPAADLDGGAPRFLGLEPLPWVARRGDVEKPRRFLGLAARGAESPLSVGVLARKPGNGALADEAALVRGLAAGLGVAPARAVFDGKTFREQATWTHAMDVVVSPHGAQLTNLLFAAECAVVVELFPKSYFIPGYFGALAASVGALPFYGYPGPDPARDVAAIAGLGAAEAQALRRAPVDPDVPGLVRFLRDVALPARDRCLRGEPPAPPRPAAAAASVALAAAAAGPPAGGARALRLDLAVAGAPLDGSLALCVAALGDRSCRELGASPHLRRIQIFDSTSM